MYLPIICGPSLHFQFIAYNIHLLLGLTTSTALTDNGLWYARNIAHVCCPAVIVYGLLIGRYDCSICRGTSPRARSWTIFVVMVLITLVGKKIGIFRRRKLNGCMPLPGISAFVFTTTFWELVGNNMQANYRLYIHTFCVYLWGLVTL